MTRRPPPLTPLQRKYADKSTWPAPPPGIPGGKCSCGGAYMDNEAGWDAHEIVMGHRPRAPDQPDPQDDPPPDDY